MPKTVNADNTQSEGDGDMEVRKAKRNHEVHWVEIDCRGRTSGFVEFDLTKAQAEKYAAYQRSVGSVQVEISRRGV
jgi:hypothetical protein